MSKQRDFPTDKNEYRLVRHRSFNLISAKEEVWFTLLERRIDFLGKNGMRPVKGFFHTSLGMKKALVTGRIPFFAQKVYSAFKERKPYFLFGRY